MTYVTAGLGSAAFADDGLRAVRLFDDFRLPEGPRLRFAEIPNSGSTISRGAYLRQKYSYLSPEQRLVRIDELTGANYLRRLDEAIKSQDYVYRYLSKEQLEASFKYNSVRGYSSTEFSHSGTTVASHAQILADWGNPALGPSTEVRYAVAIPVSELRGYRVVRPFGGKGTIGWEFRTNSYPTAGPGGWIQFEISSVPLDKVYIFKLQ